LTTWAAIPRAGAVVTLGAKMNGQPTPQIYANVSRCSACTSDIAIVFSLSQIAAPATAENALPTDLAIVRLSPPAAKMLLLNLRQMVAAYEKDTGTTIYVPKEFEEGLRRGDVLLSIAPGSQTELALPAGMTSADVTSQGNSPADQSNGVQKT
jgi:hypothetical protein